MTRSTRRAGNDDGAAAKEIRSFASTQSVIRILKHLADEPLDTARLSERLRAASAGVDVSLVKRALVRLRHQGIVRLKGSRHSLTPAGRKLLKLAISRLKDIVALTGGKPLGDGV
jgi:hypothetical protein